MNQTDRHTPGKLDTYKLPNGDRPIRNEDGYLVALVSASAYEARAEADAARLALCWNMHEDLLGAIGRLLWAFMEGSDSEHGHAMADAQELLREGGWTPEDISALSRARGEGGSHE